MREKVTRNGQITLPKKMRKKLKIGEGSIVEVNLTDRMILIEKRDKEFWEEAGGFLPEKFEEVMKKIRKDEKKRFEELGII